MEKNEWGVHEYHCCSMHGCKYGDDECPVYAKQIKQMYLCEYCSEVGFDSISDIHEYEKYVDIIEDAKLKGLKEITIDIKFVDKLFKGDFI